MCWLQILEEEPEKKTTITLGGVPLLIYVQILEEEPGKKTNITHGGVSLLIYVLVADSG